MSPSLKPLLTSSVRLRLAEFFAVEGCTGAITLEPLLLLIFASDFRCPPRLLCAAPRREYGFASSFCCSTGSHDPLDREAMAMAASSLALSSFSALPLGIIAFFRLTTRRELH